MKTKKILAFILSVMMVMSCLTLNVMAAEGFVISVESNAGETVEAGDEITYTVYVSGSDKVGGFTTVMFSVEADEGLEYVTGSKVLTNTVGYAQVDFNEANMKYVGFGIATPYAEAGKVALMTLKYTVADDAAGALNVELVGVSVGNTSGRVTDVTVEGAEVEVYVPCTHEADEEAGWKSDNQNHWHVCKHCGEEMDKAAHVFEGVTDETCDICGAKNPNYKTQAELDAETLAKVKAAIEAAIAEFEATEAEHNTVEAMQAKLEEIVAKVLEAYPGVSAEVAVDVDSFTPAADGKNGAANYKIVLTLGEAEETIEDEVEITATPVKKNTVFIPRLYTVTVECEEGAKVNTTKTFKIAFGASRTIKITAEEGYVVEDVLLNGKSVGAVESVAIKAANRNYSVKVICAEEAAVAEDAAE